MKKIFLLFLFLDLLSICHAQSLTELEKRHKTEVERKSQIQQSYTYTRGTSFDLFDDYEAAWGFAYDYSKAFPLALSVNYAIPYLSIGAELGLNFDSNTYITKQTETELELVNPNFYLTLKPGLNLKYLTMSCGVGFVGLSKDISENRPGYTFSSTGEPAWGLFLKPEISGFIPICDNEYYISLHVGYNICTKYKELNGISFGVGFQISM